MTSPALGGGRGGTRAGAGPIGRRAEPYGLAELATARQYGLPVTWLIVDDGDYGILRSCRADAFGAANRTELARPDFAALAASFGVPATRTTPERLREDLAGALATEGPAVVVLPAAPRMFAANHREP